MFDAPARQPAPSGQPAVVARCVQLLHTLPDGCSHIDWMLTRPGELDDSPDGGDGLLITFRLEHPLHETPIGASTSAERIADHRRRYLNYEGPVSRNRGDVRRLAEGLITTWASATREDQGDCWTLDVDWCLLTGAGRLTQRISVAPDAPQSNRWTVTITRKDD